MLLLLNCFHASSRPDWLVVVLRPPVVRPLDHYGTKLVSKLHWKWINWL